MGLVIRTDPVAGETLKKGDTVKLIVSKGRQPVVLLPFVGMQLDLAVAQLDTMKLKYKVTDEYSDKPVGEIIGQNPAENSQVTEGSEIELIVSKGPENPSGGIGYYSVTIPLPTDRSTAELDIYVDGKRIYYNSVDCTPGSFFWSHEDTAGPHHVLIYLDGERVIDEENAMFDADE